MADLKWSPGMFVWRELMTDDVEVTRRLYGELFGWSWRGMDAGPDGTYWIASRDGREVGGLMKKPAGAPMPSYWSSYILVDDVDAAARRCTAAGGQVLRPPDDIPNVGRFAVVADPSGAVLQPFRAAGGDAAPPLARAVAGTFCWETLATPDVDGAIAFYGAVFGLGTGPTPNGEGKVLTAAGGVPVADLQPARPGGRGSWSTYVAVEDAEASRDRAVRLGGKVIVPRIDVPKVGTVAIIADPSGATLGLFQPGGHG
jgi:predicted enzyme related to lactoylglutathione lyase